MLMEKEMNNRPNRLESIPSLDLLIDSIDRQVDKLPSPYADAEFTATLSSSADALRKQGQQYIRFELAGLDYALPLQNALEIDYIPEITPLPNLPKWVLGICHLRGDIVSVVDLKLILKLKTARGEAPRKLVLIQNSEISTAIMVDDVASMRYAEKNEDSEIVKKSNEEKSLPQYVERIIETEDRLVHLLDVDVLMTALEF